MAKVLKGKLWEERHKWLMWFWILMLIPCLIFRESILLVILMSWYANVENSAAAMEAKKGKK